MSRLPFPRLKTRQGIHAIEGTEACIKELRKAPTSLNPATIVTLPGQRCVLITSPEPHYHITLLSKVVFKNINKVIHLFYYFSFYPPNYFWVKNFFLIFPYRLQAFGTQRTKTTISRLPATTIRTTYTQAFLFLFFFCFCLCFNCFYGENVVNFNWTLWSRRSGLINFLRLFFFGSIFGQKHIWLLLVLFHPSTLSM